MMRIGPGGVLHPGEMGSVLGAILRGGGGRVGWASEGRSGPSHDRAPRAGLEDVGTLPALVRESAVILAVCPPHAALAVAREVASHKFSGLYLDGNAISPETARAVGRVVGAGGASFVDGGIVGPRAKAPWEHAPLRIGAEGHGHRRARLPRARWRRSCGMARPVRPPR